MQPEDNAPVTRAEFRAELQDALDRLEHRLLEIEKRLLKLPPAA